MTAVIVLVAALALVSVLAILRYREYRGKRILICPETNQPVGAEVDALKAARTWVLGQPKFVITNCSRWPEREGCDQACVPQVAKSPDETLVRTIVERWYRGSHCVYCGKAITESSGAVAPALRTADGEIVEWSRVAPEDLPAMLAKAEAVCGTCDLAADFRRRFPQLVTDRDPTPLRNRAIH